ncbi:MAG: hypothetical protein L0H64_00950 [Pseudonocardia sp.]|nr:hypothetical protein [Pseudonocardia sp.]
MSVERQSRPRRLAVSWRVRVVLAVAVLAQLFACQAVLAPVGGNSTAVVQDVGHGIGHDLVCEAAAATAAPVSARVVAPDCTPHSGAAVAVAVLIVASLVLARRASYGGMPPWAPRRLVAGRNRLLAVGIARI